MEIIDKNTGENKTSNYSIVTSNNLDYRYYLNCDSNLIIDVSDYNNIHIECGINCIVMCGNDCKIYCFDYVYYNNNSKCDFSVGNNCDITLNGLESCTFTKYSYNVKILDIKNSQHGEQNYILLCKDLYYFLKSSYEMIAYDNKNGYDITDDITYINYYTKEIVLSSKPYYAWSENAHFYIDLHEFNGWTITIWNNNFTIICGDYCKIITQCNISNGEFITGINCTIQVGSINNCKFNTYDDTTIILEHHNLKKPVQEYKLTKELSKLSKTKLLSI